MAPQREKTAFHSNHSEKLVEGSALCEWCSNSAYACELGWILQKQIYISIGRFYIKNKITNVLKRPHPKVCFFMLYHGKLTTQFPPPGREASYLEFRNKEQTGILNITDTVCGELVFSQSSFSSSAQGTDNLKTSFYLMVGERFHCQLLFRFSWTGGRHTRSFIANSSPKSIT